MRILPLLLAIVALQAPPPGTDVFLATLATSGGSLTLGAPVNISDHAGYDNQPAFTPDGAAILFTSDRSRIVTAPVEGAPPATPRTDIYRYDIAAKRVTQVTDTMEAEYSPTITPDGRGISAIRVEADGTQRLWRFLLEGKNPALVLPDVKPVGYHAWIDAHRLALFVLGGRGLPATLQLADTATGKAVVIATDIGRSLQRMPSGAISFVQREAGKDGAPPSVTIKQFDADAIGDARVSILTSAVAGSTQPDLAWLPDGSVLMAHGGKLHQWRRGAASWRVVADLDAAGLRSVSRLAVSPGGDRIAIVAEAR